MRLKLSKFFIACNLYVVALCSSAFEVNLSPVSLFPGSLVHGNVLFESNEGRVKYGPTLGMSYIEDAYAIGARLEIYSADSQYGSYITLGNFIQSEFEQAPEIYVAYAGGGNHKALKWDFLGGDYHSKLGGGVLYLYQFNSDNRIFPEVEHVVLPFIEWKIGVSI